MSAWIVRVVIDHDRHFDHTFAYENDARYYLADCQAQGYTAELREVAE